jgi:hypothetical protein
MPKEKFMQRDLERAADDLAMLRYWMPELRAPVMSLLAAMCPHREALQWLVAELVNHVGYWPGPSDVRGLLCNRYDPADGVDAWCSLPGYRAEDNEARHYGLHEQRKIQERSGGFVGEEASRDLIRQIADAKRLPPGRESRKSPPDQSGTVQ